jgi:hypothetical protein
MELTTMKSISVFGLLAVCAIGYGCISSTQMTGVWHDPGYTGAPEGSVLVLGIGATEIGTRLFEDAMYTQLVKRNMRVMKGSNAFPVNAPIDTLVLREYVISTQVDLLSVTRLVDVSKDTEYVPGTTAYVPVANYYNFSGYYTHSYAVVHEPGYMRESVTATIETNVYSAKTGGLVWSGRSQTVDPASIDDAATGVAHALVTNMAKCGVFGPKAKE